MKEIKDPHKIQIEIEALRKKGKVIGFVPTMGALHDGHLSLVRKARTQCDVVVVSIFVNPAQFGPKEDFEKYPRPWKHDKMLLSRQGVDILFLPEAKTIYGDSFNTWVEVNEALTEKLCGPLRPGHFRGVTTIVTKLFNIVKPHHAYFGAKDYQQATLIRKMTDDLNFDIRIHVVPTLREKDGLAMSSRNQYLNEKDRQKARGISQTLFWIRDEVLKGERNLADLRKKALLKLKIHTDKIDYLEIIDPDSLESLRDFQPNMVAAAACYVGKTRLIDNVIISAKKLPTKKENP